MQDEPAATRFYALVLVFIALLAFACNGGDEGQRTTTPAPSPSATPAATATPQPTAYCHTGPTGRKISSVSVITATVPNSHRSTARDMTQAFYAFVNQDAFKSQPGPEISKRVDAAVKDKKTDLDIILAMQAIVVDELKLADIPLIYSGYKVRTPATVWKSANATGKALMLASFSISASKMAFSRLVALALCHITSGVLTL
ncbi:MAG: hypothetical protein HGA75_19335 [Thiobacillus sp.]|nr:hypothetical protein [Thiobacillus sp.]